MRPFILACLGILSASCAAEPAPKSIVMEGREYRQIADQELFSDLAPTSGKSLLGQRVVGQFILTNNRSLERRGPCGELHIAERDWSLQKIGPKAMIAETTTIFACFPSHKSYERYAAGCIPDALALSGCHAVVAGRVAGPRQFRWTPITTWPRTEKFFYLEVEGIEILGDAKEVVLRDAGRGVEALIDMKGKLGDAEDLSRVFR